MHFVTVYGKLLGKYLRDDTGKVYWFAPNFELHTQGFVTLKRDARGYYDIIKFLEF